MKKADPATGMLALFAAFATAAMVGIVNGVGIGYLRILSVIVTFATSLKWF